MPNGLLPVDPFELDFLPTSIGPWVADIADRMQCPLDFVGVPATVALGAVIGRKIGVRPQCRTDWIEVPNLWGCIVGRPGTMKSPAMQQALAPLHRLETEARKDNEATAHSYAVELEAYKLRKEVLAKKARTALKGGGKYWRVARYRRARRAEDQALYRERCDLRELGRDACRQSAWRSGFSGRVHLGLRRRSTVRNLWLRAVSSLAPGTAPRATPSIASFEARRTSRRRASVSPGSTQPGRISEYIRRALSGAGGDDGLIQRFGLLVWPDECPDWKDVDRYPDSNAREAAWATFSRLSTLAPDDVGAQREFELIPFLRFDEAALGIFAEWRSGLERRLRSAEMSSALESHLAKYRKLVPSLALISHLADGGSGPITDLALLRADAYANYLETHAVAPTQLAVKFSSPPQRQFWLACARASSQCHSPPVIFISEVGRV